MSFAATAVVGGIATLGGAAISASAASKDGQGPAERGQRRPANQGPAGHAGPVPRGPRVLRQGRGDPATAAERRRGRARRRPTPTLATPTVLGTTSLLAESSTRRVPWHRVGRGRSSPWMRSDQNSSSAAQARVAAAKAERMRSLPRLAARSARRPHQHRRCGRQAGADPAVAGPHQRARGVQQLPWPTRATSRRCSPTTAKAGRANPPRLGSALTGANRLTRSTLMGRGLGGGTALAGSLERNARSINESMSNQLSDLGTARSRCGPRPRATR